MDAERALTELGLSGVADADSLRRAYLRKVRAHSPERDPEGFQRVRAAYDFLRDNPWLWPAIPVASPTPAPAPPADPTPAPALEVEAKTEAAPRIDPEHAAKAPVAEPVQSVREILRTPALDSLFQKWIDVHDARALDDPAVTARTMIELFSARVVGAETPLPAPEATFQLILVLFEKHEARLAGDLLTAFEERSRADGSSHGLSSASAACHKLLRELFALRGHAPKRLTALLARAIREGEPPRDTRAIEEAVSFVGSGFWEGVSARAPTLFAMLRPFLPKSRTTARSVVGTGFQRFGWWIPILMLLQFVRLIPQCSSDERAPRPTPAARAEAEAAARSARVLDAMEAAVDGAIVRSDCEALDRDFPLYRLALGNVGANGDKLRSFMERRNSALDICPGLSSRIPGTP